MSLSGFVGAGAGDALEELIAQRLIEQQMEDRRKQAEEDRTYRAGRAAKDDEDAAWRRGRVEKADSAAEAAAKAAADQRAYQATARANMSELVGDPVQMAAFGVASGEMDPKDAINLTKKPEPKKRPVIVKGLRGEPVSKMVSEDEEVEVYREPKSPSAPAKPEYVRIEGPDGKVQLYTPDEIRARGGVATAGKGVNNGPDQTKARETLTNVLDVATRLQKAPGRGALTGRRVGNPAYGLGVFNDPIAGTSAADAKALYDSLKSTLTLENIGLLKGVLSDRDMQILQSAATALDPAMSDQAFDAELARIIAKAQAGLGGAMPMPRIDPMTPRDTGIGDGVQKWERGPDGRPRRGGGL